MERVHAIVRGYVQGVSYRYFVQQNAGKLGVTGWVRNRFDKSVELVAEGEKHRLEELISHLRQGPRSAQVDSVDVAWGHASGEFTKFKIRTSR